MLLKTSTFINTDSLYKAVSFEQMCNTQQTKWIISSHLFHLNNQYSSVTPDVTSGSCYRLKSVTLILLLLQDLDEHWFLIYNTCKL